MSGEPLAVEALAVREGDIAHLLLANLTPDPAVCEVSGLPPHLRILDEATARLAADDPWALRDRIARVETTGGGLRIGLPPFAVGFARVRR